MTIINLDENSTKDQIKKFEDNTKNGKWLIRYHASWCGHCISMSDEWKKLEKNHQQFNLASVEESALKKLSKQPNNLLGFPSIHLVNNGQLIKEHEGKRDYENFKSLYTSNLNGGKLKSFKNKKNKKKSINNKKKSIKNKKNQ